MSTATLKKSLGEGGAFIGDSHGDDNLHAVLKALAETGQPLAGIQATPAAATIAALLTPAATKLTSLKARLATTGTAGQTDVDVDVDGVTVATVSVLNTDADGLAKSATLPAPVDIAAGALVELVVSAIPTAGADITATAQLQPVTVQP